jgi:KTSC domain
MAPTWEDISAFDVPAKLVMIPVTSSDLTAVGYAPISGTLRVRFKDGREYEYEGVSADPR